MITEINADTFAAEVTRSDRPVLVDFFTPTCRPCNNMLPILSEIAGEREVSVKVVKIDAFKEPALAADYRVKSVPNFVLFRGGAPVAQRAGSTSKREMLSWIDGNLA